MENVSVEGGTTVGRVAGKPSLRRWQTPEGNERARHVDISGEALQGKELPSPKSLITACLAFLCNTKKARVAGDEWKGEL